MKPPLRWMATATLVVSLVLLLAPLQQAERAAADGWDKVAHFGVFGLILWSFGVLFPRLPRLTAAALVVALGGLVEILQGFVGRDPSGWDFVADAVGVAVALLAWAAWRGFRPRRAFQKAG